MIRHLSTGQVARALRSACLPILCFLLLPIGLTAQSEEATGNPAAAELAATTKAKPAAKPVANSAAETGAENTAKTAAKSDGTATASPGANPAAEPDTLMLLVTGIVVLMLLYTRRRVRVLSPRAQPQP